MLMPNTSEVIDGIYENIPDPEYRAWDRMSASTLGACVKKDGSMKTLKASVDGHIKISSDAIEYGKAFHCRMLEPERFKSEFVTATDCQGVVKSTGKVCGCTASYRHGNYWYCGKHAPEGAEQPDQMLTEKQYEELVGMCKALFAHPAVNLLRQHGGNEVSIAWTDEISGVKCKGRLDKLIRKIRWSDETGTRDVPMIVDLKAIRDATVKESRKEIDKYGYHYRAAMYCDGIKKLTGEMPIYVFIMIEKEYPYEIGVYPLGTRSLEIGRNIYKSLLQRWAHCLKTNEFPGINNDDLIDIELPEWTLKQEEFAHE